MIERDKVAHFFVNIGIVLAVFSGGYVLFGLPTYITALLGIGAAFGISVAKEYSDKVTGGVFSLADLWADYAGIAIAGTACLLAVMLGV